MEVSRTAFIIATYRVNSYFQNLIVDPEYQIRIYNTIGQLQQDLVANQNPFVFHSKELPTGIYYYEILNVEEGIDSGEDCGEIIALNLI